MASASIAEGTRALEVGSDPSMTLADLGQLVVGVVQLVEHLSMPF